MLAIETKISRVIEYDYEHRCAEHEHDSLCKCVTFIIEPGPLSITPFLGISDHIQSAITYMVLRDDKGIFEVFLLTWIRSLAA